MKRAIVVLPALVVLSGCDIIESRRSTDRARVGLVEAKHTTLRTAMFLIAQKGPLGREVGTADMQRLREARESFLESCKDYCADADACDAEVRALEHWHLTIASETDGTRLALKLTDTNAASRDLATGTTRRYCDPPPIWRTMFR